MNSKILESGFDDPSLAYTRPVDEEGRPKLDSERAATKIGQMYGPYFERVFRGLIPYPWVSKAQVVTVLLPLHQALIVPYQLMVFEIKRMAPGYGSRSGMESLEPGAFE